MIKVSGRHIALVACLAMHIVISSGCTEDVAAPSGVEQPFTMYGILNPRLDRQTVAVTPVTSILTPVERSIDATVKSTNLLTGEVFVWKDSVFADSTDQLRHVFWSEFRPDFDSRHQMSVVRSDGVKSTVDVKVPPRVSVELDDRGSRFVRLRVIGGEFRLHGVKVIYGVRRYTAPTNVLEPRAAYAFRYTDEPRKIEDGWEFRLNLAKDYDAMYSLYALDLGLWSGNYVCQRLALDNIRLGATVGSEDWNPPGGLFDANVLAQPGVMTNVSNGFGFVGGGYYVELPFTPSAESILATWFYDLVHHSRPPVEDDCSPARD